VQIRRAVVQLGIVAVFAGTAGAQYAPNAEFKCMQKVSKVGAKFLASKSKCVTKCVQSVWKGLVPASECSAPYGPFVAACIGSAEAKFGAGIQKACEPGYKPGTACPSCFSGGDCSLSGEASDRVQNFENQIDEFFPSLFCETTPPPFLLEMRCMVTAAKGVVKYFAKATKCYDKCYGLVQKALVSSSACEPPASEPFTAECLTDTYADYVKYIDHDCGPPPASPDGCSFPYPTATDWIDLMDVMVTADVNGTYCASPSGAFVE
jgi:hypothetical protein